MPGGAAGRPGQSPRRGPAVPSANSLGSGGFPSPATPGTLQPEEGGCRPASPQEPHPASPQSPHPASPSQPHPTGPQSPVPPALTASSRRPAELRPASPRPEPGAVRKFKPPALPAVSAQLRLPAFGRYLSAMGSSRAKLSLTRLGSARSGPAQPGPARLGSTRRAPRQRCRALRQPRPARPSRPMGGGGGGGPGARGLKARSGARLLAPQPGRGGASAVREREGR